jgi:hypothetical protein
MSVDESFAPTVELSTQDIADNILDELASAVMKDEDEKTARIITTKAAFHAVETIRMFFMQQDNSLVALTKLNIVENHVEPFAINVPKVPKQLTNFSSQDATLLNEEGSQETRVWGPLSLSFPPETMYSSLTHINTHLFD